MGNLNHIKKYTAHGKFLITGEYAVLDNVPALAIPLRLNQYLEITPREDGIVTWKSYDVDGDLWFETQFTVEQLIDRSKIKFYNEVQEKLILILRYALWLNPLALDKIDSGLDAVTTLDFNRKYGMGTSSTLISLVSQWLECDPYALQFECFGGSGYDIACATAKSALVYNYNNAQPVVQYLNWNPAIKDSIFFVYLNRKQNSRDSIARFDSSLLTSELRTELSAMPQRFIEASNNLADFNAVMHRHECIISSLIGLEPMQQKLFPDYTQAIKSLGGWGGDFIMCTGGMEQRDYFKGKDYDIILEWDEVIN